MKNQYKIVSELLSTDKTLRVPENWEIYKTGDPIGSTKETTNKYGWIAYEGGNDWECSFKFQAVQCGGKEGLFTRIWLQVKYPPELNEKEHTSNEFDKARKEFGKSLLDKWISLAKKDFSARNSAYSKWSKESDIARSKDLEMPQIPKESDGHGEWGISFFSALHNPEILNNVESHGVDRSEWKISKGWERDKYIKNIQTEMKVTVGPKGVENTWQAPFPVETKCCHCGSKARIAFVGKEDRGEKEYICNLHDNQIGNRPPGPFWLHDLCAVAIYFCTKCTEPTALYNQG